MDIDLVLAKQSIAKEIASGDAARVRKRIERHLKKRPQDAEELASWVRETLNIFRVNEATIAAKIAEGLEAYKYVIDGAGTVHQQPDFFTQHKFVETAAKMLDMFPAAKTKITGDEGGIIVRLTPQFGAADDAGTS